jgi:hypothetical protein
MTVPMKAVLEFLPKWIAGADSLSLRIQNHQVQKNYSYKLTYG